MAKIMMSDFELNTISACKWEFHEALQMGCMFHWKRALCRKQLELHVPKQILSDLLGLKGLLNILTVVPVEETDQKLFIIFDIFTTTLLYH